MDREYILKMMPAPDGKDKIEYAQVVNGNIIKTIHKNMSRATELTKDIAPYFKGDNVEQTCKNIWEFLRHQIKYVKDEDNQDIKLPNRFLKEGTGDCKSYSLFAGSILKNLGIPEAFRYASYTSDPTPQHVYVVAITGNRTPKGKSQIVITDGVWHHFNKQKPFTFKKDYMPIRTLSGTDSDQELGNIFKKAAKSLQKAGSKVQDAVKNTGVVKKASQLQDQAKGTKVVKQLAKIQDDVKGEARIIARKGSELLKQIPDAFKMVVGAPARRAFRTLVAMNFHGYANKLASDPDQTFSLWSKLGGSRKELQQSIDAGLKRKKILGIGCLQCQVVERGRNQIGEPGTLATVAAFITAATPIILAFLGLLRESKQTIDEAQRISPPADDVVNTGGDSGGDGIIYSYPGAATVDPNADMSNFSTVGQDQSSGSYGGWPPPVDNRTSDDYSRYNYDSASNYGDYYDARSQGSNANSGKVTPEPEKSDNTALLVGTAILAKLLFF